MASRQEAKAKQQNKFDVFLNLFDFWGGDF